MSEEGLICGIDLQFTSEAEEDFFAVTPCGHAFHNSCLMAWFNLGHNTCPLDRRVIEASNLRPLHGINSSRRRTTQNTNPTSTSSSSSSDDGIPTLEDLTLSDRIPEYQFSNQNARNNPTSTTSSSRDLAIPTTLQDLTLSARRPDYTFKIVLLGPGMVGKSSLLQRFAAGTFNYNISTTVGVDFATKRFWIGDKLIQLSIFDTCGQERFKAITRNFGRNAHGAMLVYSYGNSLGEAESLREIPAWIDFLKTYGSTAGEVAMLLVGNKIDVSPDQRGITSEDGHVFARQHNIPMFETSALDDIDVNTVFRALAVETLEKVETGRLNYVTEEEKAVDGVVVPTATDEELDTSCCDRFTDWFASIFSFSSNEKVD